MRLRQPPSTRAFDFFFQAEDVIRDVAVTGVQTCALPIFPSENHTDEALVVTDDSVLTFFEINGAGLNPAPAAQVFDFDLNPQGALSFPHLEYRVTDAALSTDGSLWVINYFF